MRTKFFGYFLLFSAFFVLQPAMAQEENADAFFLRAIHDEVLRNGQCYDWLRELTAKAGPRLSGSPAAEAAVTLMQRRMQEAGFDTVYLQPCLVPRWERGEPEVVRIVNSPLLGTEELAAVALGNSEGTGPDGLVAEVIEVFGLDTLDQLGEAALRGKIVFFNRPLDPTQLNTFAAYGGAVDQRALGAARAARYGAVGVIVRSMTTNLDDVPHTGNMSYDSDGARIPAMSISTQAAELLSRALAYGPTRVYMRSTCRNLPPVPSYNVIGEVRGSTHPDEIILTGGHLDAWDLGEGAHDDGSGCVQAMQVWPLLNRLGYRPQRTLRCVLFMNEENGLVGGRTYWQASNAADEFHLLAIESDRGGFIPRGFSSEALPEVYPGYLRKLNTWLPLLEPYGLAIRSGGGSGADISGLRSQGGLLLGLMPDSQRYFDYHHTDTDTFDKVNKRELELGAAAMTAMVYLVDKYGLE
jgi:hypothetical protein